MNIYRVVGGTVWDEAHMLWVVEIRHWWLLWLRTTRVKVIYRETTLTALGEDFAPIRDIFVRDAIRRHTDRLRGGSRTEVRERREGLALKAKQQKGLEG